VRQAGRGARASRRCRPCCCAISGDRRLGASQGPSALPHVVRGVWPAFRSAPTHWQTAMAARSTLPKALRAGLWALLADLLRAGGPELVFGAAQRAQAGVQGRPGISCTPRGVSLCRQAEQAPFSQQV
jgi:hypothetical protein